MEYDGVFNPSTNWRVAGGALTDSISFESDDRISPVSTVDQMAKSQLLLLPPSPDGEPCEITITFAQEHEVRQIYIRSSARVYEVYYTKKQQRHDKEYLCTVRCGVAMRQDKGSNEDDWVDVKAGDASHLRQRDLFEATAEINDAEPCISITLRLLSLLDKTCALVDEVYVFADPSESDQEEATGTGNTSTSSMMAMFMPTLLQLSRGKDVRKVPVSDKSNSTDPVTLGDSNDSGKIATEIRQETSFCKDDHKGVSSPFLPDTPAKHVDAAQVSGAEFKPGMSYSNVETILHQLVSKVSHIETILTRFEDQMLKPINSIDARLQLVEKNLELLSKKSIDSELFVETRKCYPDSPSSDTDKTPEANELDPLTKDTNDPHLTASTKLAAPESSTEDYAVVLPNDMVEDISTKIIELERDNNSISENEMISTESEINNGEIDHSFGSGAFEETPKHSLSINDALASALAGLLSSTSFMDIKDCQSAKVTAPEFSNEDKAPTVHHPDKSQAGTEKLDNTETSSESPISSQKEPGVTLCIEDDSKEMINGVIEKSGDSVEEYDDAETVLSVRSGGVDEDTLTSRTEAEGEPMNHEELENPNVISDCGSCRLVTEGEPERDDVLKSLLGYQHTSYSVDFLSPILDVKFNTEEKASDNQCFFEALLRAEAKTVVDGNKEVLDENLVSVEDEELKRHVPLNDDI